MATIVRATISVPVDNMQSNAALQYAILLHQSFTEENPPDKWSCTQSALQEIPQHRDRGRKGLQ